MKLKLGLISLLLLALLAPTALADGNFNAEGYPICNEPVEIDFAFASAADNHDWESRVMVQKFHSDFGIDLKCTAFSSAADLRTQLTLWMVGDDLPDLIGGGSFSATDVAAWGEQGYLLNWADYLEYMPNLTQLFEAYPEYRAYLTAPDGGIYGFSKLEDNVTGRVNRVFINNNWLKNVGMQAPTSVEELLEVLRAFRDQDANGNGDPTDEIPFGYSASGSHDDRMLLAAFGLLTRSLDYILIDENGAVKLANTGDAYKAYVKYLHTLYEDGLIDPECYLITDVERKEKVKNDQYGFFGASAPFAWSGKSIDYDANFTWVAGLTSEMNDVHYIPLSSVVGANLSLVASADAEHPEAIARLMDWCFSPEGELALQRGWEGENFQYEYIEELNGYVANMIKPDKYASAEEYKINEVLINNVLGPLASRAYGTQYRLIHTASDEQIMNDDGALLRYGWAVLVERGRRADGMVEQSVFPPLAYTAEEAKQRASLQADISSYIATARAQFVIGEVDIDEGWDNYVATIENMRLNELLAIENAAYARYQANR